MYNTITLKTLLINPAALSLPSGTIFSNNPPEQGITILFDGGLDYTTDIEIYSQKTITRMQKDYKGLIEYKGRLFRYAYIHKIANNDKLYT